VGAPSRIRDRNNDTVMGFRWDTAPRVTHRDRDVEGCWAAGRENPAPGRRARRGAGERRQKPPRRTPPVSPAHLDPLGRSARDAGTPRLGRAAVRGAWGCPPVYAGRDVEGRVPVGHRTPEAWPPSARPGTWPRRTLCGCYRRRRTAGDRWMLSERAAARPMVQKGWEPGARGTFGTCSPSLPHPIPRLTEEQTELQGGGRGRSR